MGGHVNTSANLSLTPCQITQPFEIYLSLSQWLPKTAAINAANAVARWIKKEEGRIFLYDAPVF